MTATPSPFPFSVLILNRPLYTYLALVLHHSRFGPVSSQLSFLHLSQGSCHLGVTVVGVVHTRIPVAHIPRKGWKGLDTQTERPSAKYDRLVCWIKAERAALGYEVEKNKLNICGVRYVHYQV